MGRSPRAYLAFTTALGLSGCLLFTDPINKAPVVKITEPSISDPVIRGKTVGYMATVQDEDSLATLFIDWAEFYPSNQNQQGCGWVTPGTWASQETKSLAPDVPHQFAAQSLAGFCMCARVTDHNGATGQDCRWITPVNSAPSATIVDVSGDPSGLPRRPLCSLVHLSAESSTFFDGDKFDWTIKYTGADAAGKSVLLSECDGVTEDKSSLHRCFYAVGPGTDTGLYTVTLTITDSGTATPVSATFDIPVEKDTPPCLQQTQPDVYARRILLSRNADLVGAYQSRTFSVLSVADDCNPFPSVPLPGGKASAPPQFVWWVLDSTQASPSWIQQVNTTSSFPVSQDQFPNARPGDTIGVRVEVRDKAVQDLYKSGGQVCSINPPDTSPAICCGDACGTPNDCVRWTTWTVQFQP